MPAFQKALEMQADMIELDILVTIDGIPIVFHDPLLDKKTNGKGKVSGYNLKEIKELDAGSWFDTEYRGVQILTLEELLLWAKNKIALNIEIKSEASDPESRNRGEESIELKVIELVRKYDMQYHVMLSSFSHSSVEKLRKFAPEMTVGLLYDRKASNKAKPEELVRKYAADSFNCRWRDLSHSSRNSLINHGIPIYIYTVNTTFWMKRMMKAGVNGIFSDRPDLLRKTALKFFRK
jgi:glycerophosphoryl diester phosphodiesterase